VVLADVVEPVEVEPEVEPEAGLLRHPLSPWADMVLDSGAASGYHRCVSFHRAMRCFLLLGALSAVGCAKPRPNLCHAGALGRIRTTLHQLESYESTAVPLSAGVLAPGKIPLTRRIPRLPLLELTDTTISLRLPQDTKEPRWILLEPEKIEEWPGTRLLTKRISEVQSSQKSKLGREAIHLAIAPQTPASDIHTLLKVLKEAGYSRAYIWLQAAQPPRRPTVPQTTFLRTMSMMLQPPLGSIPTRVGARSQRLVNGGPRLLGRIVKRLSDWADDRCPAAAKVLESAAEKKGVAQLKKLSTELPEAIVKCGCNSQNEILSGLLLVTAVPRVFVGVLPVKLDPLSTDEGRTSPQAQWREIVSQKLTAQPNAPFWIRLP
jgi:hypothetical protein